jgi:hypothetical protein
VGAADGDVLGACDPSPSAPARDCRGHLSPHHAPRVRGCAAVNSEGQEVLHRYNNFYDVFDPPGFELQATGAHEGQVGPFSRIIPHPLARGLAERVE